GELTVRLCNGTLSSMDKDITYYELSYLLGPARTSEDAATAGDELRNLLVTHGGTIDSTDAPMKRRLGYEIGGGIEAYFGAIRFTTAPANLAPIKEVMDAQKDVLRHMIVKWQRPQLQTMHRTPSATYTPRKEEGVATDVAALDKQLEEILKD
ncbi:MAG: 30S ribosomal protein S6, partial [Patescibacteria group bacterium]